MVHCKILINIVGYFFFHSNIGDLYFYLDIHECNTDMDNCHDNATCVNTIGSHTCNCKEGFTGNGTYCEGIV